MPWRQPFDTVANHVVHFASLVELPGKVRRCRRSARRSDSSAAASSARPGSTRAPTAAAWSWPAASAVTKEPGTDRFARRFADAGFAVLAFDYRRLGESGGAAAPGGAHRATSSPTGHAAVGCAGACRASIPHRVAVWGFSAVRRARLPGRRRDPGSPAAIAQTPNVDGPAATRQALRYQTTGALLRLFGRALADALGSVVGRPPLLVPLVGPPGSVALLTTPDALDTDRALDPDGRYADWPRVVAARSTLRIGRYSPGRAAAGCPARCWSWPATTTGWRSPSPPSAPRPGPPRGARPAPGRALRPFLGGHERAVEAELAFLRRHLLAAAPAGRPRRLRPDRSGSAAGHPRVQSHDM